LMLLPVAYVLMPMDLLAETIPILGVLDDLIVVRYGYPLLLKMVPKCVLEECRQKVQAKSLAGLRWFRNAAIIVLLVVLLVISGTIYLLVRWVARSV